MNMSAQNVAQRSKNTIAKHLMKKVINPSPGYDTMTDEKKKMKSNTEDDYNKAIASDNPTKISKEDLEKMTKEAMKKFKSLS